MYYRSIVLAGAITLAFCVPTAEAQERWQGLYGGIAIAGQDVTANVERSAIHRYSEDALSRPVIGIVDTGSGYNACHGNMADLIAAVTRGVQLAGGLAVPFPTISLHESFSHPTSMYLRSRPCPQQAGLRSSTKPAPLPGSCDRTV